MHISGVELQVIRIKKPTGILDAIGRDWGGLAHLTLGSRGQHCKCALWVARQWSRRTDEYDAGTNLAPPIPVVVTALPIDPN